MGGRKQRGHASQRPVDDAEQIRLGEICHSPCSGPLLFPHEYAKGCPRPPSIPRNASVADTYGAASCTPARKIRQLQKPTNVIIETANVTGGSKLHARLGETDAHILLGQEHHWPAARLASEAAATRRRGWDTSFGAAAPSPLSAIGTNGGVSVSVASGLRQRPVTCMPSELQ